VAVTAAVLLGLWQLHVWQDHRDASTASLVHAPPRPLDDVLGSDQAFPPGDVGRPVRFSGRWLPADTVYVAGRQLHGRTGVWAVTPVAVCAGNAGCSGASAVLVVRGWTADPGHAPAPPTGPVTVTGWLQPGEGAGGVDRHPDDDVLPQLRVADLLQRVDRDLYGGYVIARTPVTPGLEAVTPASLPAPDSFTGLRNLLYALEWWLFGGFAVFLWGRWCRDELAAARERGGPDDVPPPPGRPGGSQVTGVASRS
jgi:cytochrome oxidase assembly protein ShyY1